MGRQLGPAITREHALQVQATHPPDALRRFEIAHIPDMLANNIGFAAQNPAILFEYVGLIFLAEHIGRLGVRADRTAAPITLSFLIPKPGKRLIFGGRAK